MKNADTLENVKKLVAARGEHLAPEVLADLKAVAAALEGPSGVGPAHASLLRRLLVWQLDERKAHYQALAAKQPAATDVVAVLDAARSVVAKVEGKKLALDHLGRAVARAQQSLRAGAKPRPSAHDGRFAPPSWLTERLKAQR